MCVDVVRKAQHRLVVSTGPLQGDVDLCVSGLRLEVRDLLVDRLAGRVEVLDEVDQPAPIAEGLLVGFVATLVAEANLQVLVEERHFSQTGHHRGPLVVGRLFEDVRIGPERDRRARALCGLALLEGCLRLAVGERLGPEVPVAYHLDLETGRERVHHRDAHPVQATGDLVGAGLELPARAERGQHRGDRGLARLLVPVDGDAPPVVLDADTAVRQECHFDTCRKPGHRLVDRVVDDLPDEVVETLGTGRADVHRGAFADVFDALEDFDVLRLIRRVGSALGSTHRTPRTTSGRRQGSRPTEMTL